MTLLLAWCHSLLALLLNTLYPLLLLLGQLVDTFPLLALLPLFLVLLPAFTTWTVRLVLHVLIRLFRLGGLLASFLVLSLVLLYLQWGAQRRGYLEPSI